MRNLLHVCIGILVTASRGLDIEARYSLLSGLVTEVKIGASSMDEPPVRVAIDINRKVSSIFNPQVVPPSIAGSVYTRPATPVAQAARFRYRDMDHSMEKDSLEIGGITIPEFLFGLVYSWQPHSSLYRDVAGVVGFGNDFGPCWSLEQEDHGVIRVRDDCEARAVDFESGPRRSWGFEVMGVQIGEHNIVREWTDVQFNLNLPYLVIPHEFVGLLSSDVEATVDPITKQLVGNCASARLVKFSFVLDSEDHLVISIPSELLNPREMSEAPGRCLFEVLAMNEQLSIGPHLISAVASLTVTREVFSVGIKLLPPSQTPRPIAMDPVQVDVYSDPLVPENASGISFRTTQSGWVLMSPNPKRSIANTGQMSMTWKFLSKGSIDRIVESVMLPGEFTLQMTGTAIDFVRTSDSLDHMLLMVQTGKGLLEVTMTHKSVSILRRFEDTPKVKCSLCDSNYAGGDRIRTMLRCRHSFHESCLISHGASRCPKCNDIANPLIQG